MSRLTLALGATLLTVEVAAGVALVSINGQDGMSWAAIALQVAAGGAFVVSGLIALARRPENRTGVYLAATGYVWFLGILTDLSNEWLFTIGFVLGDLVWVMFTALVLAYPTGRLGGPLERAIPVAIGLLIVVTSSVELLFDPTPAPERCDGCPGSAIVVAERPGIAEAVGTLTTVVGVGLIGLIVAILYRRWRRATPAARRVLWPVIGAGVATFVSIGLVVVADQFSESAARVFQVLLLVTFSAVPFAFLFGILRTRLARSAVSELVVALDGGAPLRGALAKALGDPSLEVAYRLDRSRGLGGAGWVDPEGRAVADPAADSSRSVKVIEQNGEPVAAVAYESSLDDEPELVDGALAAAGLALRNERLQAELRAEVRLAGALAETAPSLLSNVDTDGRILKLNDATRRASGYERDEEVLGKYFWDVFISEEEREAMKARFTEAAPHFPAAEYENTFTNLRGERLVIYWHSAPVLDEGGRVVSIVAAGLDITERHRLEAEKEREREFLNAIANNAPSLLCLIDDTGRVTDRGTNIAFEQTLEHDPAETDGDVFWERYVDPADAEAVRGAIERVIAGEEVPEQDNVWVTSTGRRLLIAWTCTALPRLDERTLFLLSGVDVTERQEREQELERRRGFLIAITEAVPSFLVAVDPNAVVVEHGSNRAFLEVFGWSEDEIVGKNFLGLVAEADDHSARMAIANAANGVAQSERESVWLARDGEPRIVAWTARPVLDPAGRSLVLVSGSDVTVRRRREEETRASEERFRAVIERAPVAILEVDLDLRVKLWNPAAERIFGWAPEEVLGSAVPLVPAELEPEFEDLLERMREGEALTGLETVRLRRDGTRVDVEVSAAPIRDAAGEVAGYMAVFGDISDRKRQEEELRASRARIVAAGDDARRRLERNLHDGAQQRLVALSVSLRLAENKLREDPAGAAVILAAAREELMHALEELRELARGIHPAVLTDRGLEPAIEALVGRTPVPVEVDVRSGRLPAAVEAASYYVVAEALTNVVKYAGASTARVRIDREDGRVVIEVADDGAGGADPARGSGLRGLADRLAALDGTLAIESPKGVGTSVRAEIPLAASIGEE